MEILVREGRRGSPVCQEMAVKPLSRDNLHRSVKVLLDGERATDVTDAYHLLEKLVLQINVGPGIDQDVAAQAALLTAISTGKRAMLGGVRVILEDDPRLSLPWANGQNLAEAVTRFGAVVANEADPDKPVLGIGQPSTREQGGRQMGLDTCMNGWTGGVAARCHRSWTGPAMPLAGVVAGALGVSEIFQHCLGSPTAARRDVGVSLWRPDLPWQDSQAIGPPLEFLPTGLWLLGLGHIGQANAWSLGCLPYYRPDQLEVFLVDFDTLVDANYSTGLLTEQTDIGRLKTRVVAGRLESLGHRTRLVERAFDENLTPEPEEPTLAVAGFHTPEPRRALGDKFGQVVDAGLGAGPIGYLDILIHTFPSQLSPIDAFTVNGGGERPLPRPYEAEIERMVGEGIESGTARCGIIDVAGATAAAAFVGATAGALSVADHLRLLHGGRRYAVVGVDLRSPSDTRAAPARSDPPRIPGFAHVRHGLFITDQ